MKLQLEFEDSDLYDMIEGYFRSNGFKIKNLTDLVESFRIAFPGGIKLQAEPIPVEPLPYAAHKVDAAEDYTPPIGNTQEKVVEGNPTPTVNPAVANPKLGFADILDPTSNIHPPSRDELLDQSRREIEQILSQSHALQEKTKEP